MRNFWSIIVAGTLVACGGGGNPAPPADNNTNSTNNTSNNTVNNTVNNTTNNTTNNTANNGAVPNMQETPADATVVSRQIARLATAPTTVPA